MKKLSIILAFVFGALAIQPVEATLYEYYHQHLPSIVDRSVPAEGCDIKNYAGMKDQNILLEKCLKGKQADSPFLGATVPVIESLFQTALQANIAATDVTMSLVNGSDRAGNVLSGTMCFTIDSGSAQAEFVCGTAVSSTISALVRGIDPITGNTPNTALQFAHRRGADVRVTDFPILGILSRIFNNQDSIGSYLYYTRGVADSAAGASSTDIMSKAYIDSIAVAGAPDASLSAKGIVQLATGIQLASSTAIGGGSTSAALIPYSILTTSSPFTAGNYVVVTQKNGFIDPIFINTTTPYLWTASSTFTAAVSFMASTSFPGNAYNGMTVVNVTSTNATTTYLGATVVSSTQIIFSGQSLAGDPYNIVASTSQVLNIPYHSQACDSGIASRAPSATGNQTIGHSLGVVPGYIHIWAAQASGVPTTGWSDGEYVSTSQWTKQFVIGTNFSGTLGNNTVQVVTSSIIWLPAPANAGGQNVGANIVTPIVSTNSFVINWVTNDGAGGQRYFKWTVCK